MSCSIITTECPTSIKRFKEINNLFTSSKCKPVVGSSKINIVLVGVLAFTKNEANLIRCASPPDKVEDDCPIVKYPKPTSTKGCILSTILLSNAPFLDLKKFNASSISIAKRSAIDLSSYLISSASLL